MTNNDNRLLIFGPPGAGKGTQAAIVASKLGIPHIDTGLIIRDNIRNETGLGVEARQFVEAGELIPNELVIRLIEDRLKWDDCASGWLLDGFPRSLVQAEALSTMGDGGGEVIGKVVFIDVPEGALVRRLMDRRICGSCTAVFNVITLPPKEDGLCDKCGCELTQRADDNEDSVRTRFRVYHEETSPIADYYLAKGLLVKVDGSGSVEDVTGRILTQVAGASFTGSGS